MTISNLYLLRNPCATSLLKTTRLIFRNGLPPGPNSNENRGKEPEKKPNGEKSVNQDLRNEISQDLTVIFDENDLKFTEEFLSTTMDEKIIRFFAGSSKFGQRMAIAINANAPEEILRSLALDKEPQVLILLTHNINTPADSFAILAKNENVFVRFVVAESLNAPKECLRYLCNDENTIVRKAAAKNKSLNKR